MPPGAVSRYLSCPSLAVACPPVAALALRRPVRLSRSLAAADSLRGLRPSLRPCALAFAFAAAPRTARRSSPCASCAGNARYRDPDRHLLLVTEGDLPGVHVLPGLRVLGLRPASPGSPPARSRRSPRTRRRRRAHDRRDPETSLVRLSSRRPPLVGASNSVSGPTRLLAEITLFEGFVEDVELGRERIERPYLPDARARARRRPSRTRARAMSPASPDPRRPRDGAGRGPAQTTRGQLRLSEEPPRLRRPRREPPARARRPGVRRPRRPGRAPRARPPRRRCRRARRSRRPRGRRPPRESPPRDAAEARPSAPEPARRTRTTPRSTVQSVTAGISRSQSSATWRRSAT